MALGPLLGKSRLFQVFLRSFLIQGVWNFEGMQNIGFAFSLAPALRGRGKESLARHLGFFNSHPYMASPIIGAVIRMEEEGRGRGEIESLKKALMGPYGAVGDSFFWGTWRPLSSVVALLITMRYWDMWGILAFLALYNLPHLWMRWCGLLEGYRRGGDVIHWIERWNLPQWGRRVRYLTLVLLGLFLAYLLERVRAWSEVDASLLIPGALVVVLLTTSLMRKGFDPVKIIYLYSLLWAVGTFLLP